MKQYVFRILYRDKDKGLIAVHARNYSEAQDKAFAYADIKLGIMRESDQEQVCLQEVL